MWKREISQVALFIKHWAWVKMYHPSWSAQCTRTLVWLSSIKIVIIIFQSSVPPFAPVRTFFGGKCECVVQARREGWCFYRPYCFYDRFSLSPKEWNFQCRIFIYYLFSGSFNYYREISIPIWKCILLARKADRRAIQPQSYIYSRWKKVTSKISKRKQIFCEYFKYS